LKAKTQFDDPLSSEGKDAYLKAAKELQQENVSKLHNVYSQIGVKGFEKTVETQPDEVPPTQPPINPEVHQGAGGSNKIGVHHAALTDLAKELGLPEPERAEYT